MPTYQYACRSCDHRFEVAQGFDEAALTTCPACEQEQLRKLFGNVGVVFKGSGFYRNDSRSGKQAKSAGGAAASSSTTGSGASGTGSAGSDNAGSSTKKAGASDGGGSGKSAATTSAS